MSLLLLRPRLTTLLMVADAPLAQLAMLLAQPLLLPLPSPLPQLSELSDTEPDMEPSLVEPSLVVPLLPQLLLPQPLLPQPSLVDTDMLPAMDTQLPPSVLDSQPPLTLLDRSTLLLSPTFMT